MKEKDSTLATLNEADLLERLAVERAMLQKLRFAHAISPLENPLRIRSTRRRVARIQTLLVSRRRATASAPSTEQSPT